MTRGSLSHLLVCRCEPPCCTRCYTTGPEHGSFHLSPWPVRAAAIRYGFLISFDFRLARPIARSCKPAGMASNPLSGNIPSNGFGSTSIGDIFRPQATGLTRFTPIARNVSIGNLKARVDKDALSLDWLASWEGLSK